MKIVGLLALKNVDLPHGTLYSGPYLKNWKVGEPPFRFLVFVWIMGPGELLPSRNGRYLQLNSSE
ncbi:MAG: hypothetical protein OXB88_10970 [Bacteriovoracales bacterium]|nr:hypothetical protein [Bacteriovoracales bacterium]